MQPSATVILDRLGLLHRMVACTKWCVDVCPRLRTDSKVIVADSWTAKAEQILSQSPDLVIASVPYQLEAVAQILRAGIPFLGLAPKSLNGVYFDISSIAGITGEPERGEEIIEAMKAEIAEVGARAQAALAKLSLTKPSLTQPSAKRPVVYCEEWGRPLIHSQEWVAELVRAAGGSFLGEPGKQTSPEDIRSADPDVIIASWCGAGDRVPLEKIIRSRSWQSTRAARNGDVFCIRDEHLNTPAPTLISGLHALASAIMPHVFGEAAPGLRRIQIVENQVVEKNKRDNGETFQVAG